MPIKGLPVLIEAAKWFEIFDGTVVGGFYPKPYTRLC